MLNLEINGEMKQYKDNTVFIDIAREYQSEYEYDILLVLLNNKLQELNKIVRKDGTVRFITYKDNIGMRAYQRSLSLLLMKSIYDVIEKGNDFIDEKADTTFTMCEINGDKPHKIEKVIIDFSIAKGFYCEIKGNVGLDQVLLDKIKRRMEQLVRDDIPIEKEVINTDEAVELFHSYRMYDKEKLFRYRRSSKVNLYKINGFKDYYYGYMVPSTGYLKWFDLKLYQSGFILQFPARDNPTKLPECKPEEKLFHVLKSSVIWGNSLGIATVGDLNNYIASGKTNELILIQEASQERELGQMAQQIASKKENKIILIAGPSSSGKTTFSHRLSIQLLAHGLNPHPIAVDDYFIDRSKTPKDEFGNYNYEDIECIDLELLNRDIKSLIKGERIELPTYNFKTGRREYRGICKQLGKDDVLVFEGIHCLNPKLFYNLPKENKFKIYLSALTQLNIDEHNRIPTTDGRLIRRIVRDARTRGNTAKDTLDIWSNVRKGEEKNIFPYQESADIMFNSTLIYELSVLKQYAEPLLFGIGRDEPEYQEATRLLKFFDYFLGITSENIPNNSIIREFIGGSCFNV